MNAVIRSREKGEKGFRRYPIDSSSCQHSCTFFWKGHAHGHFLSDRRYSRRYCYRGDNENLLACLAGRAAGSGSSLVRGSPRFAADAGAVVVLPKGAGMRAVVGLGEGATIPGAAVPARLCRLVSIT